MHCHKDSGTCRKGDEICGPAKYFQATEKEWTLSMTPQSITQNAGVRVTQGSVTGTLKTALTGASSSVVISTAADVVFVATTNVVIGSTTVLHSNIASVSSIYNTQLATNGACRDMTVKTCLVTEEYKSPSSITNSFVGSTANDASCSKCSPGQIQPEAGGRHKCKRKE